MQTLDNRRQLLTQPQQIKPEEVTQHENIKSALDEGFTVPEISLDEDYNAPEISLDEDYNASEISLDEDNTAHKISLGESNAVSKVSLSASVTLFANVGLGKVMQWFIPSYFEQVVLYYSSLRSVHGIRNIVLIPFVRFAECQRRLHRPFVKSAHQLLVKPRFSCVFSCSFVACSVNESLLVNFVSQAKLSAAVASFKSPKNTAAREPMETIWTPPSWSTALQVKRSSRLRTMVDSALKPFPVVPVFRFDINDASDNLLWAKLGDGMSLYFEFLKQMCFIFAIMTLLSLPQLIISYLGGNYVSSLADTTVPSGNVLFTRLSIGNLFYNDSLWIGEEEVSQTRDITVSGMLYSVTPRKMGLIFALLDITGIIFFLVHLETFSQKVDKIANKLAASVCNIQKYSIIVKGLPYQSKAEEIRSFFEAHGAIADVKVASYPVLELFKT
jgi:hypothetical protein